MSVIARAAQIIRKLLDAAGKSSSTSSTPAAAAGLRLDIISFGVAVAAV